MKKRDFSKLMGSGFEPYKKNSELDDSVIKAALNGEFTLDDEHYQVQADQVQKTKSGKYVLRNDIRKSAFKQIKEKHLIEDLSEGLSKENQFGRVALSVLRGETIDLTSQSFEELQSTFQVVIALPESVKNAPSLREIEEEMSRREFLIPLERLTRHFAGRRNELSRIKDYVDWLPKETISQHIRFAYRNAISWHNKPPLLIKGIGGIGKSTLIAQFILEHVSKIKTRNQKLPFVYVDFDLAGLSIKEPLYFLVESVRQLSMQFPKREELFQAVITTISDHIDGRANSKSYDRSWLINDLVFKYETLLRELKSPVLVVFDSFEELQYKATKKEFRNFMRFIKEVSETIPRIRPVFVGRGGIDMDEVEFDILNLISFDKRSAMAYVKSLGLRENDLVEMIVEKFGGNPLTLQLAASLAISENVNKINQVQTHRYFSRLEEGQIQRVLVERNLDHIHDHQVRKLAMPGLLIRKVDIGVIQHILSEPCGLGEISEEKAHQLFRELSKETFLIQNYQSENQIIIRQDLREAMIPLVKQKDPVNSRKIHENAQKYYQYKKSASDKAEWVYHKIQNLEPLDFLDKKLFNLIRPYLERSVSELPISARVHIAKLQSTSLSDTILEKAKQEEWESYYVQILRDAIDGEFSDLEQAAAKLEARTFRLTRSELLVWEAELNIRLDRREKASKILTKAINELSVVVPKPNADLSKLALLQVKYQEYQHRNRRDFNRFVLKRLRDILEEITEFGNSMNELNLLYHFMRAHGRLKEKVSKEHVERFTKLIDRKRKLKSNLIATSFEQLLLSLSTTKALVTNVNPFLDFDDYLREVSRFEYRCKSLIELDNVLHREYGLHLKEVSKAGSLQVSIIDAVHYIELSKIVDLTLNNSLDKVQKNN